MAFGALLVRPGHSAGDARKATELRRRRSLRLLKLRRTWLTGIAPAYMDRHRPSHGVALWHRVLIQRHERPQESP